MVAEDVPLIAFLYAIPAVFFLLFYSSFIFAGFHYLFVRHPAEAVAAEALRSGELFDKEKLVDALSGDPQDLRQASSLASDA